ncbi:MAG TPA: hypothetical protein VMB80_14830 [Candidatus Acidoferrum sp.]|nr:hypothetical protein [Candidatus Acidoferrum sp.]
MIEAQPRRYTFLGGLSSLLALVLASSASATSIFTVDNLSATIPDNDLNGYQNSQIVSGLYGPVTGVTVSLNIAAGFNGDLYVFVQHNNALAVLLNRVGVNATNGVGYLDGGFNITLDDAAANDVHFYQNKPYSLNGNGQLTGTWQPDGRFIDPLSAGSAFVSATRGNQLSVFDGLDANGTWTLFAADVSPGGVSILQGWGLAITVVPEPGSAVMLGCGLACGLAWTLDRRSLRRKRQS